MKRLWLRDEMFTRGDLPMTKFETRVLLMALLDVTPGDVLLDVGAGTGSVSIQAALFGAEVYALEQNPAGVDLIEQNARQFGVNLHIVQGKAPEALAQIPPCTKCLIGGSQGQLVEIFKAIHDRLPPTGIVAATFIKPDNLTLFQQQLAAYRYAAVEIRLLQTAVLDQHGMLRGQNPIFVARGLKP